MATLEQLMLYGTRRKVRRIAEMVIPRGQWTIPRGFGRSKKTAEQKILQGERQTDAEQAENVARDRQSVQQMAESLSGLLVALDALTIMHCATRSLTPSNRRRVIRRG